ncbi:MAG: LacI family transcriptional regulator [Firmicutes bacterium]|nr:LacI family transcriptional regulator [Bacillota bacterium]
MSKKVTIAQIAEALGVSSISVSRALSGSPGVSDELRGRIKEKAAELGYKRGRKKTKNVLLLIKRKFEADSSNFSLLVQSLEHYIRAYGMDFSMEFVAREKQEENELPKNLRKGHSIDGIILLGQFVDEYIALLQKHVPKMVILNGTSDQVEADFVYFNFNRSGYQATRYLLDRGHTQIGLIGVEGRFNTCQRLNGYRKALAQAEIALNPNHVIDALEGLEEGVGEMIAANNLPSAFVCNSDRTAMRLIKYLHDRGISVPEQVSVVGSGNMEVASWVIPPLTTFDLNLDHACQVAAKRLLARIEQPELPEVVIFVNPDLVERKSVQHVLS